MEEILNKEPLLKSNFIVEHADVPQYCIKKVNLNIEKLEITYRIFEDININSIIRNLEQTIKITPTTKSGHKLEDLSLNIRCIVESYNIVFDYDSNLNEILEIIVVFRRNFSLKNI